MGQVSTGQSYAPPPVPQQPPAQPQFTQPPQPPQFQQPPQPQQPVPPHYGYEQPPAPGVPLAQLPPPVPGMGEPPVVPQQPPEAQDLRDVLSSAGIDTSVFGADVSDTDILQHVANRVRSAQQYEAMQPYIQQGLEVAQNQQAWEEFQRQRAAGQPPQLATQPPPPSPPSPLDPPPLDATASAYLDALRNGQVEKEAIPVGIYGQLQKYAQWEADMSRRLLTDPESVFMPRIQPKLDERYATRESVEKAIREQFNALYGNAVAAQYDPLWYERDPATGQTVIDPTTGQQRLTAYGAKWQQDEQFLRSMDPDNPAHFMQLMQRLNPVPANGNGQQQQPPQQQMPPQQQVPQQPVAPPPQTPQQSFVDVASQMHTQYPGYPPAQRGGTAGQPPLYLGPDDLAPPVLSQVQQQVTGRPASSW